MVVTLPAILGRFEAVEPFSVEPGTIIWDRFCVVGPVRHEGSHWSAPVVDIRRELGTEPNHRMDLQYLDLPQSEQDRLHRALSAESDVQTRAHAMVQTSTGIVVLCDPHQGERVKGPMRPNQVLETGLALAGMLVCLHEAGITGIALTLDSLRTHGGRTRLHGLGHLRGNGDEKQDVQRLIALLEKAGGRSLDPLSHSPPASARELWERLRMLARAPSVPLYLPSRPPFVGRHNALQHLEATVGRARVARATVVVIHGPRGVGKTRLVDEFVVGLSRQARNRPIILRGSYANQSSETQVGLASALEDLVGTVLSPNESSALATRLRARVQPFGRILCRFAPRLQSVVGDVPEPPEIDLSERYNRHAHTIAEAIRVIGTPEHPLVITLDNLEHADSGSLAILQQIVRGDPAHHTVIVVNVRGEIPLPLRCPELAVLELPPLGGDEVAQLLEGTLQAEIDDVKAATRTLHNETQGLCLAVWSTLQAWLERGVLTRRLAGEPWHFDPRGDTSASVQDLYVHRLLRAKPDERWLALLAAVRGGQAGRTWLSALVSWDESRLSTAFADLEQSGLMLTDGADHLFFPHESVRDLLLEVSSHEEIRKAHGRLAQWLSAQGPDVSSAQLAFHAELGQAEHLGDLRTLHMDAGHELMQVYDLERAAWHFEQALERARSNDERRAALAGCADAYVLDHQATRAAECYSELIELTEDVPDAVRIAARATYELWTKASNEHALALGVQGLQKAGSRLPRTMLTQIAHALCTVLALGLGEPRQPPAVRDSLCRLYGALMPVLLLRDPITVGVLALRGKYLATDLNTPNGAFALAFYGAVRGAMGHFRAAKVALIEAEEIAAAAGNEFTLGACCHFRGHAVELPAGEYLAGQRSLDRAVAHFRNSGDISVAGLSMYFKAAYGLQREPSTKLLAWLTEAAALTTRQGNELALLQVEALRLLVERRLNKPGIEQRARELATKVEKSRHATPPDILMARAHLALVFLQVGDRSSASDQIQAGNTLFDQLIGSPEICYDFHVAKVLVRLAQPILDSRDRKAIGQSIRQLRRAGRKSPRLRAAWLYTRMRYLLSVGRIGRALRHASLLLGELERHGEKFWALETHYVLADFKRAEDTVMSLAHERTARALCRELQCAPRNRPLTETPTFPPLALPRARPQAALAADPDLSVEEALEALRPTIHRLLANVTFVVVQAASSLRVRSDQATFESLLVNLLCTARDAVLHASRVVVTARRVTVEQAQAAELAGARAGEYVAFAVEVAPGPCSPVLGGLVGCQRIAAELGGFLGKETTAHDGMRLMAYLPLSSTSPSYQRKRTQALIVHPDPLVRRTLVAALSQLDFACHQSPPDAGGSVDLDDDALIFADAASACALGRHANGAVVEILSRTEHGRLKDAHGLRVPFAMEELTDLLHRLDRDSNEGEVLHE